MHRMASAHTYVPRPTPPLLATMPGFRPGVVQRMLPIAHFVSLRAAMGPATSSASSERGFRRPTPAMTARRWAATQSTGGTAEHLSRPAFDAEVTSIRDLTPTVKLIDLHVGGECTRLPRRTTAATGGVAGI